MKVFGSISRLVSILFRKDSQDITVRPNQSTTYTAARDIQLPPGDAAHVLTSASSTQTLTNKTIDGDDNTVQDLALSSLKTVLGDADEVILRDAAGAVVSAKLVNANIDAAAAIDATKIADGSVTNTEFQYIGGLTSDAQTQINGKQADVITTQGDIIVGDGSGDAARVAIGTSGYVLTSNGTTAAWAAPATSILSYKTDWVTADTATKVITHSLNSLDIQVEIFDKTDGQTIHVDSVVRTDVNTLTLSASEAPGASGWRVVIHTA